MKTLGTIFLMFFGTATFAQSLKSSVDCDMSLQIVSEEGNNGLGVTFDEKGQRYYTAFAGNSTYPLEAFNVLGNYVYTTELGIDARGFWYNPSKKCLEGIGYGNKDAYSIAITPSLGTTAVAPTIITETETYGMETQQVGAYCGKKGILFVQGGSAHFFKKPGKKAKVVSLNLNSSQDALNMISPIYTGVKGKEIGLFNSESMTMEFYSASNGAFAGTVNLNYYSCVEELDVPYSFRVSYANNRVWIYDTYSRSWLGFSVWN